MSLMGTTTTKIVPPKRYPSGDRKPTEEPKGHPPTLVKRILEHGIRLGADRRLGTPLGILHLEGVLTESEFEAGLRYAEDIAAYERAKMPMKRHAHSQSFEFGRKGNADVDLEALRRMDPELADKLEKKEKRRIRKIEKRYERVRAFAAHDEGVVKRVCCNEERIAEQHHAGLKAALGRLAKACYRLHDRTPKGEGERKPRPRLDAAVLASAAVDALEHWFAKTKGTVTGFALTGSSITAHGHTEVGEVLAHTIEVRRTKHLREAIAAQLLKAAEAKGWANVTRTPRREEQAS